MKLAIGLMSGTSCDGVSAALAAFQQRAVRLIAYRTYPYPEPVRALLRRAAHLTTRQLAQTNILLGELLASAAMKLLRASRISPSDVSVVGSHGHTVYHGPMDPIPCTLQLGEPAILAERIGRPVAADFRMRDMAAGGQGAPLVPFFDHYFFGRRAVRAMQNIGGIANVTVVGRRVRPLAFDTGPGNGLIDAAMRRLSRGRRWFDAGGRLAAQGRIDQRAMRRLLAHPYFRTPPPKSTGPELFNDAMLTTIFGARWPHPQNVVATLTSFTALTIAESYRRFVPVSLDEVVVSGGGASNRTLMGHLARLMDPIPVRSIARYGLPPQAKEPVAFAFLAMRALQGRINHLPHATGALQPRILGSLIPANERP